MSLLDPAFVQRLQSALGLDLPYPERPPFERGTPASVLLLFGASLEAGHDPSLLVTRRTDRVETHKGQMAFPGGMKEAGESVIEAALRETEEEVGISRAHVRVLGQLPEIWTITDFWVTPVVGVLKCSLSEISIQANPHEIDETLWVPLSILAHEKTYQREFIERGSVRFPIHCYYVGPERELRIWGATGAMIQNLLERLRLAR